MLIERRRVMSDRLSKALKDLKKMPLFGTSPRKDHAIKAMRHDRLSAMTNVNFHDRFSDAVMEEAEKSAFVCESCGQHQGKNRTRLQ